MLNPVSIGFSATQGALAFFAPCAVALLPGYLATLLARDDKQGFLRVLGLAAGTVLGIVLVYAVFSILIWSFAKVLKPVIPWLSIVMGVGLGVVGILMLLGKDISLNFHGTNKTHENAFIEAFLFGIGYAIAALGCLFPLFLAVVTFAIADSPVGILYIAIYVACMSAFMVVFYLLASFARHALQKWLRKILPYMARIAGVAVLLAGIYIVWYQSVFIF